MNKIDIRLATDTVAQRSEEANLHELTASELDQIEGGIWPLLVLGGLITLGCAYKSGNP